MNLIKIALAITFMLGLTIVALWTLENAMHQQDCIHATEMMELIDRNSHLFDTNQDYLDAYAKHRTFWLDNCTE